MIQSHGRIFSEEMLFLRSTSECISTEANRAGAPVIIMSYELFFLQRISYSQLHCCPAKARQIFTLRNRLKYLGGVQRRTKKAHPDQVIKEVAS